MARDVIGRDRVQSRRNRHAELDEEHVDAVA
jgi:hypothetical protein